MKIICIGRNYRKHAEELNNPVPSKPLLFFKPDTAVLRENKDFYYPEFTKDLHFECELVVRVAREGKYIQPDFVRSYLDGVGLGIDMTARDIQSEAKAKGHPWTLAKGFNNSAPVSDFLPIDQFPNLQHINFTCDINGERRQEGFTGNMIFTVTDLIVYLSQFITIKKGDLIFTGTPAGVGPLSIGDHINAHLEGQKMLDFYVK
ncbi:MAG: fumarylacetoacetate hydrolase family protein [Bacteroidota bacterium]